MNRFPSRSASRCRISLDASSASFRLVPLNGSSMSAITRAPSATACATAFMRSASARKKLTPVRMSSVIVIEVKSRSQGEKRNERAGTPIDLRPREFAVLELLMRNAGAVVSKTMILSQVWGYSFDPGSNVVDVVIFRLREKIDKGFAQPMLHTVRGAGYVLKDA